MIEIIGLILIFPAIGLLCWCCYNIGRGVQRDIDKEKCETEFFNIPTNGDRIRAMLDEELAVFLREVAYQDKYCHRGVWDRAHIAGGTIMPWIDWLKAEVK